MKTEGFLHDTDIVRTFYDADVEMEWNRLDKHPVEFELTKRFLRRYISDGARVLDVGGGPGRYSLWLAERGCRVTLADLSQANVEFGLAKAAELGLELRGLRADARDLSALAGQAFDHVLLMGPLYHLTDAEDRKKAVRSALALLAPGGMLAVSFISAFAGILYAMRDEPDAILNPDLMEHFAIAARDEPYSGMAFTQAYFARRQDILPFMDGFGLEKLHFLSAEGMLSPYEANLLIQPPEVLAAWIDYAEKLCERQDILSFAEHYLYIGRKPV
ncbi:MAG: class I SAM-dependent methyltransferase [Clostridia bacterium]|nr:class I SAM-dependent methyltransferase [Clostridia bacterium]